MPSTNIILEEDKKATNGLEKTKAIRSQVNKDPKKLENQPKKTFIARFFSKSNFTISNILIGVCVLFLISSIGLLLWPNVGTVLYAVNPPDEKDFKYAVSNPALLNPDYSESNLDVGVPDDINVGDGMPSDNWLIVPSAGVDTRIIEGSSISVLNTRKGSWREPNSGNPLSDSNMVIACHRFQYLPPNTNTCYNLDKVSKGDRLVVYWKVNGKLQDFVYEIKDKFIVDPTEVWIRNHNPENGRELTIFTCGPEVFESSKRIVVKAVQL